ncbi:Herpes-BLLF1 domain-containing protein [Pyrenophora tritici-repentis]|nr:Herpes-BLLF1 domain-containing protein [Pyrenophora tritici-repentis]
MSGAAIATSPKTPSAKKVPANSSPMSKGPAKVHRRKSSASQVTPKTPQRPKVLASQSTPKKVPQQRRKTSAADSTPIQKNKRQMADMGQSPKKVMPARRESGTSMSLPMIPPLKKQKIMEDTSSKLVPANPFTTNPVPPNPFIQLLHYVLQKNPTLLPPITATPTDHTDPSNTSAPTLTSPDIDRIAHSMWDVAFKNRHLFHYACQYSAMFTPLKLRILAKINFLPSWWFLREAVINGVRGLRVAKVKVGGEEEGVKTWRVDDSEMSKFWGQARRFCEDVEVKLGRAARKDAWTMTDKVEVEEEFKLDELLGYVGGEMEHDGEEDEIVDAQ